MGNEQLTCLHSETVSLLQICTPQERIELGNLDREREVSSLMCSLQSVQERTGLEGSREQITNTMLPE
jgi:hypothetical protein